MTDANIHDADAPEDVAGTEAAGAGDPSSDAAEVDALRRELQEARQEAAQNYDQFLRTRADMENYRKRMERTYADRAEASKKDILRKLLGVKDNLERALQYGRNDGGESRDAGEGIFEGVRLTQYQLEQLLIQEGVTPIEAEGKPFDPKFDEAVHRVENHAVPDHTVVQVVRQGYTYGDDVLRPAQVVVSVHSEAESLD